MRQGKLSGLRVAILATDGFEQSELRDPRKALNEAGATTEVVSPKGGEFKGWNHKEWGQKVRADRTLDDADPKDYDALLLPGGVMSPDALRMQPQAVALVKSFFDTDKPVAAICHGPWTVIESGAARGYRIDLLAFAEDRHQERRRRLGRSGSRRGRQPEHQSQA
jgi:protease I